MSAAEISEDHPMTLDEAVATLGLSRGYIRQLVRAGVIKLAPSVYGHPLYLAASVVAAGDPRVRSTQPCDCLAKGAGRIRCYGCGARSQGHIHPCDRYKLEQTMYQEPVRSDRTHWVCGACRIWPSRPAIPTAVRHAVIARDGMICRRCGCAVVFSAEHRSDRLHLDHVVQWAEGGEHTVENLIVTCAACNLSRPKVRNTRTRR